MAEESTDRRFGFAELVEGLLVQRRIMSDRREVVAASILATETGLAAEEPITIITPWDFVAAKLR
jgi:hypothetical protein